jgi:hypothetical protein
MSQLNSSLDSLDGFLLSGTLDVTGLAASADSVAAAAVPPQPTTSSTLSALAAAEVRDPVQGCRGRVQCRRACVRRRARLALGTTSWSGPCVPDTGAWQKLACSSVSPWEHSRDRPG